MESKFLPAGKEIVFLGEKITLVPVPLRRYKDLILKVAELMESGDMTQITDTKALIERLQNAPEKIGELCELVSGIPKDRVLDASFEEAVNLLVAAVEINNVIKVFKDAVKKVRGPMESGQENTPST